MPSVLSLNITKCDTVIQLPFFLFFFLYYVYAGFGLVSCSIGSRIILGLGDGLDVTPDRHRTSLAFL